MVRRLRITFALGFWFFAIAFAGAAARADAPPADLNAVAKNVVQIAQVKENQIILLTSDPANFSFLEDLAVAVRAARGVFFFCDSGTWCQSTTPLDSFTPGAVLPASWCLAAGWMSA